MTELTVKILTPVGSENEVFDHLVQVQRLDTLEVGLLLCSHCCSWPKNLLNKATWIEGCYTPAQYKGDKRLLLGYHPSTMTEWKYREEDGEVFVDLMAKPSGEGFLSLIELDGWQPLPSVENRLDAAINMVGTRTHRHLSRLWREARRTREDELEVLQVYCRRVAALVDHGVFSDLAAASALTSVEEAHDVYSRLELGVVLRHTRNLVHSGVEVYADAYKVVVNKPSKGYLTAVNLYNDYSIFNYGRIVVTEEANMWEIPGYAMAEPIKLMSPIFDDEDAEDYYDEDEVADFADGWFVNRDAPELGFYAPIDVEIFAYDEEEQGHYVVFTDVLRGYAEAVDLEYPEVTIHPLD